MKLLQKIKILKKWKRTVNYLVFFFFWGGTVPKFSIVTFVKASTLDGITHVIYGMLIKFQKRNQLNVAYTSLFSFCILFLKLRCNNLQKNYKPTYKKHIVIISINQIDLQLQ